VTIASRMRNASWRSSPVTYVSLLAIDSPAPHALPVAAGRALTRKIRATPLSTFGGPTSRLARSRSRRTAPACHGSPLLRWKVAEPLHRSLKRVGLIPRDPAKATALAAYGKLRWKRGHRPAAAARRTNLCRGCHRQKPCRKRDALSQAADQGCPGHCEGRACVEVPRVVEQPDLTTL
jgi:hypothetical protein